MNHPSESQMSLSSKHWLNVTETITMTGSFVAAIAAVTSQQFAGLAALPLSISLALSLANRNRLLAQMSHGHLSQLEQLKLDRQADQKVIDELGSQTESLSTHLMDLNHHLTHNQELVTANAQLIKNLTVTVETQSVTQRDLSEQVVHLQKATAKPDEFYYEDGLAHQKAGQLDVAVNSFNLAIKANESMAEAYYHRGLAQAELGQRQMAISDLRIAASLFFEQGKLEQYQKAKDLSKNVHEAMAEGVAQATTKASALAQSKAMESISVDHLFN